jgi:drug/metabolite transporter (DMT)-like permease
VTRLIGLGGVFALSFSAVFFRLAHVSQTTATLFRAVYAAPVLGILYLWARPDTPGTRPLAHAMAIASGVLLALDLVFWHMGIDLVGMGLATIAASIQVVLVATVGWARDGERPSAFAAAVIGLVLTGVALTSGVLDGASYGASPAAGVAISVLAGICYAGFLVVFRDASRLGLHPVSALTDATFGMALGALACAGFDAGFSLIPTWPAHGWLAALAVVTQVGGWLCLGSALPHLPALETSVLLVGQPVLAVCWGMWLFDERLSGVQWMGSALVLVGVATLSARGAVQPSVATRDRSSPWPLSP